MCPGGWYKILPTSWCPSLTLSLTEFGTGNRSRCLFFFNWDFPIMVRTGGKFSFLSSPLFRLPTLVLSSCLFEYFSYLFHTQMPS